MAGLDTRLVDLATKDDLKTLATKDDVATMLRAVLDEMDKRMDMRFKEQREYLVEAARVKRTPA